MKRLKGYRFWFSLAIVLEYVVLSQGQICNLDSDCLNGGTCTFGACICTDAFSGNICEDIEECVLSESQQCSPFATCTKMPGYFTCTCIEGFTGDGDTCTDVDECALSTHNCESSNSCTNIAGAFLCTACRYGFELTGSICTALSCNGSCGTSAGTCFCDAVCTRYGDCCGGYKSECVPQGSSCNGHCNEELSDCFCDQSCIPNGDCCEDYGLYCAKGVNLVIPENRPSRCDLFNEVKGCQQGYECNEQKGYAECMQIKTSDNFGLVIGLSVGFSMFFLVAFLLAAVKYHLRNSKGEPRAPSRTTFRDSQFDRDSRPGGLFADGIATRFNSSGLQGSSDNGSLQSKSTWDFMYYYLRPNEKDRYLPRE